MDDPIISQPLSTAAGAGLSSAFEALFRAAPSPFLVVTPPRYTIIAVNDAYLHATMTERASVLGRGLFEVFPANPDDPSIEGPPKLAASLKRVVADRSTDEMPIVRYDIPRPEARGGGFEERWWSPRNAPVIGPDGEVQCIIHHVEDVTARVRAEAAFKRAEVALRASEEKFRTLFQSLEAGFCIVEMQFDPTGRAGDYRFLEVNPAFEKQTGIANATGRWMREIAPNHEEYWFEIYGRVATSGQPVRFENRAQQLGRTYDVYAFRIGEAAARRVAILFNDITARTRTELALRESEQRLLSAVAERDALLKEVHHRVKNNLQVITSLLEMQARQVDDRKSFGLLMEARNRVGTIASIHELLYRAGSFTEIDLIAWVRQLGGHLIAVYQMGDRVKLTVQGGGVLVELDRAVPLGLLLNEVVSNVCKHAFPAKRQGELTIHIGSEGERIRIEVVDNGVGMPAEVDPQKPTSLGLQIVHTLVVQLHGALEITSASGTGTHLRLTIRRRA